MDVQNDVDKDHADKIFDICVEQRRDVEEIDTKEEDFIDIVCEKKVCVSKERRGEEILNRV